MVHLNDRNVVIAPWCESRECEEIVKDKSGKESKQMQTEGEVLLTGQAKTLCVPLDYEPLQEGEKCFYCGDLAKVRVLWGRSY
jgi:prolyl-tRNA synthetase